jgi:hypothetical protein
LLFLHDFCRKQAVQTAGEQDHGFVFAFGAHTEPLRVEGEKGALCGMRQGILPRVFVSTTYAESLFEASTRLRENLTRNVDLKNDL